MKSRFLILLVLLSLPAFGFARIYAGVDYLRWKGKLYGIGYRTILSKMPDYEALKVKLDNYKSQDGQKIYNWCSEWEIRNKEMYLARIYATAAKSDTVEADLTMLFGKAYLNGKMKANWYTDTLKLPAGKFMAWINMETPVYAYDLMLAIKDGQLISEWRADNSKTHESVYARNPRLFADDFYARVNWRQIPDLKDSVYRVGVIIFSGEYPRPDSVYIRRKVSPDILNEETERVLKSLDDWDVYYLNGKYKSILYITRFEFSEELRKKYARTQ